MIKINNAIVGNERYPNNESIMRSVEIYPLSCEIELKFESDADIATLIMYKKFLDDVKPNAYKRFVMKYIPYSRMDRNIEGYIFSLRYFCKLINELNFDEVIVLDPHSNMSKGLLDRCVEIDIAEYIKYIFENEKIDYVFYPDAGAMKRYSEILTLPNDTPYFFGNKKRDLQTGKILKYELVDKPDLTNKTVLIIDDLCSYGGTFLASAKEIKDNGALEVLLYVSHCEESIYLGDLLKTDLVDKVYTTDSILKDFSSNKIHKLRRVSKKI